MTSKLRNLGLAALFVATAGCSDGQHTFYWYRPNTGAQYFVKDHNMCLFESDNWPYNPPNWQIPPQPLKYDLRFRENADSGIWAFYVPLPGAQPVYVNSLEDGQWSMSPGKYAACMRARGYEDMYYPVVDRSVGTKRCTMAGCADFRSYASARRHEAYDGGEYERAFNSRDHVNSPYTSHYYGMDSILYYDAAFPDDDTGYYRRGSQTSVNYGYPDR